MWIIYRPDSILIWKNKEVKSRLKRYYAVMNNKLPAKFQIAKKIEAEDNLKASTKELWRTHKETSEQFRETLMEIDEGKKTIKSLRKPKISYLDLKAEIARRIMENCHFCERRCGVNRLKGEKGTCGAGCRPRVSTAFLHTGEEAPLVPSGTIFFTGCPFKCVFCQNYDISQFPENGKEVTPEELARIAADLKREGALNINWVGGDPLPNTYAIIESLKYLDLNVTQLWNSDMFCSVETMELLFDVIDFWLPDFKYGNDECAFRLSKVKGYWEIVSRNHKMAYNETVVNGSSAMIIRHLVLPNHVECCTEKVLKFIADETPLALVNVMQQYRPEYLVSRHPEKYPDVSRRPNRDEINKAYGLAKQLDLLFEPVS